MMLPKRFLQILPVFFVLLCLAACGGSDSNDSDSPNSNTDTSDSEDNNDSSNTSTSGFAFNQPNTLGLLVGQMVANPASSASTSAITYSSSEPTVATVDADGKVTAIAIGSTTITAAQAADANYEAESITVEVNVIAANFTMTSWIGQSDSEVEFSAGVDGIEFYRSTDSECDLRNYALCSFGQLDILNGMTVSDNAATVSRSAFYNFVIDNNQTDLTVATQELPWIGGPQVSVFNGRLFAVGGDTGRNEGGGDDVWVSDDGRHWALLTDSAGFPERKNLAMAVFDNKLWITGGWGLDENGFYNELDLQDLWYSSDGEHWTQAATPAYAGRSHANLISFNGKLWLIGGYENAITPLSDVWSSSDGVNWTQESNSLPFEARHVVVFNNQFVAASVNGIWASDNGVDWTELTADTGYTRADEMEVHNDELWVMSNINSSTPDEVWTSTDGTSWTKKNIAPAFNARFDFEITSFNNRLFVLGGHTFLGSPVEHQWFIEKDSLDNERWRRATPGADLPARTNHVGISFNNKLWMIGGRTYSGYLNDVWSSSDGINWTEETPNAAFSSREDHKVVEYNGKLWLYGGTNGSGTLSDVWSSTDGIVWSSETADPVFATRYDYGMALFNNTLFLLGGNSTADDSYLDEVWHSTDGVNWTQDVGSNFPTRSLMGLAEYNSELWMAGGEEAFNTFKNDVWHSTDGVSWTQATASAAFGARSYPQLYQHNNRLHISSGALLADPTSYIGSYTDIWSTTDGVTWTEDNDEVAYGEFFHNPVVDLDGTLWMLGGTASYYQDDDYRSESWRSTDGVNWRRPQQYLLDSPN